MFRALARVLGRPEAGLAELLDLVAAGRLVELAEGYFPDATRRESAARFAEPMRLLLTLAAIRSGSARWEHSWSGSAVLVGSDGQPLDLEELAKLAVAPDTLPQARAKLAELGIRPTAAGAAAARQSGAGATAVGGISDMRVSWPGTDRVERVLDLIVLSQGLVLVEATDSEGPAKDRMSALLRSVSPAELVDQHLFLPFEEITAAVLDKQVPIRFKLTMHDGRHLRIAEQWWGSELLDLGDQETRESLQKVLQRIHDRAV